MDISKIPLDAPICSSGKRPWRDEAEAKRRLRNARAGRLNGQDASRRPGMIEAAYYQCGVCHWWHLRSDSGSVVLGPDGKQSKMRSRSRTRKRR